MDRSLQRTLAALLALVAVAWLPWLSAGCGADHHGSAPGGGPTGGGGDAGAAPTGGGGHGAQGAHGGSGPFGQPLEFECTGEYGQPPAIALPADEAPHRDYFEWWYWTGHLRAADGRRFGFQVTFFEAWPAELGGQVPGIMGHFAITDVDASQYVHDYRFSALSSYAESSDGFDLAIADWSAAGQGATQQLSATMDGYSLDLSLVDVKRPSYHFGDGHWAYPAPYGGENWYYSRARLAASGTLEIGGTSLAVEGVAWMDQQWGEPVLEGGSVVDDYAWDWMQLQLSTGEELMVYTVHLHDQPWASGGTWVGADCSTAALAAAELVVTPLGEWQSPHTGSTYSSGWQIELPEQGLTLTATPVVLDQEFYKHGQNAFIGALVPPQYWEGAVDVHGTGPAGAVTGVGYVEVTR